MHYAKLVNDCPSYAPRRMKIGNAWVYNPTDEQLLSEGYLTVIETDAPETDERHFVTPHWAIQNNQIVQSWEIKEIPISDEEAITRYANELTGQNDPDLISAAETMITKLSKED